MKRTLLSIGLLAAGFAASAQIADTVKVYRPDSVIVINSEAHQGITILGSENNPNFRYNSEIDISKDANMNISSMENRMDFSVSVPFLDKMNKKESESSSKEQTPRAGSQLELGGTVLIGLLNPINDPSSLDFNPWKNSEVGFPSILKMSFYNAGGGLTFSISGGYNIKRFKSKSGIRYMGENGDLVLGSLPENATKTKSMITIGSFTLSPLISVKNKKSGTRITAGPMINFNRSYNTTSKYHLDGKKHKEHDGKVNVEPVTVDFFMGVSIENFPDFYVKFAPGNILKTDALPKFSTWSIGLCLDLDW